MSRDANPPTVELVWKACGRRGAIAAAGGRLGAGRGAARELRSGRA
jgi:hypothetical protein